MDTYFARHTQSLDIDLATRARLWADDLIAVHYPERIDGDSTQADNASLDINDYPRSGSKARTVIVAINALAKDGGYVCAEYYPGDQIKPSCCIIAKSSRVA